MAHKKTMDNTKLLLKVDNNPVENIEEIKYFCVVTDNNSKGKDIFYLFGLSPVIYNAANIWSDSFGKKIALENFRYDF